MSHTAILADVAVVIGAITLAVAAITGGIASVFAVRADVSSRRAEARAVLQRTHDVQPHCTFEHWDAAGTAVTNTGGAVKEAVLAAIGTTDVTERTNLVALRIFGGLLFSVPANTTRQQIPITFHPEGTVTSPEVIFAVGLDADGSWWDLLSDQPFAGEVPAKAERVAWAIAQAKCMRTVHPPGGGPNQPHR